MPAFAVLLFLVMQSDSAGLVSHARRAQEEFERARLFLLLTGSASGSRCDARIGRFCFTYSGDGGRLPREPEGIGRARTKLLVVLDSVARALPGDEWVAGQRVRYLVEAAQPDSAVAAARACRARGWWCAALEGLAWHEAGDYAAADGAFRTALDSMPEHERCRWTDLSGLLENPLRAGYRRLSCKERHPVEERVWWLAQPLWSLPGNDRRTEHYARLTMSQLLAHAQWALGEWGDDARELVVRYGWPLAFERDDCGGLCTAIPLGYLHEPSLHFVPDARAFDAGLPDDAAAILERPEALERYAPAYAVTFEEIAPDFAAFRRGDSALVVADWDVSRDTTFRDTALVAALVLARDEHLPPVVARRSHADEMGVLMAEAPWAPAYFSLELLAPGHHAAGRFRARPAPLEASSGAVALSGILPFEPAEELPADLDAALARAHAGGIPVGGRIGLYWEVYGLSRGEDAATAVSVTPVGTGWLRRVAAALGLARTKGTVRLEWHEAAQPHGGVASRALVVDLAGLVAGRYRVEMTVSAPGRAPVTSTRVVELIEQ